MTAYDTVDDTKEGIINFIKPRSRKAQNKSNLHIFQSCNTRQYILCHFKSLSLLMLFLLLGMLNLPWFFWKMAVYFTKPQMGLTYSVTRLERERNREKEVRGVTNNRGAKLWRASYAILDIDLGFF